MRCDLTHHAPCAQRSHSGAAAIQQWWFSASMNNPFHAPSLSAMPLVPDPLDNDMWPSISPSMSTNNCSPLPPQESVCLLPLKSSLAYFSQRFPCSVLQEQLCSPAPSNHSQQDTQNDSSVGMPVQHFEKDSKTLFLV